MRYVWTGAERAYFSTNRSTKVYETWVCNKGFFRQRDYSKQTLWNIDLMNKQGYITVSIYVMKCHAFGLFLDPVSIE